MALEHLAIAFQATCRLWQTSFAYLQGVTRNILTYLIYKDDRISTLPDDILYSIISSLTERDALKASMLSRRWRYLCASKLDLNFDLHTVFGAPTVRQQLQNGEMVGHRCPKYKREFLKISNQVLEHYVGPKICYFRISFCLGRECSGLIDQWVGLAVRMGVEKLELNFVCAEAALRKDNYNNLYTVSLKFLSEASKLKHLRLHACILKLDLTGGFNSLTNLHLYSVFLSPVEWQTVLRNCFNLERLTVDECTLPVKLCICGLFCLKIFTLRRCEGLQNLELSATNLTTFEITDLDKIKFSFSSVPKLEKVFFCLMSHNSMPYIFGEVAKVLPQLKTLSIYTLVEWVKYIPGSPTAFSNVKQLELFMFKDWQYDLVKIIAPLLSALPLLQKLYVAMPSPKYFERRVEGLLPGHLHSQLKEVEIGGFSGTWNQIEFAIYLLKNAVALERMVIDWQCRIYFGNGDWQNDYTSLWSEEKRMFIRDQLVDKIFSWKTEVIIR